MKRFTLDTQTTTANGTETRERQLLRRVHDTLDMQGRDLGEDLVVYDALEVNRLINDIYDELNAEVPHE